MKRDEGATQAAYFFEPKSYVAKDGREILFGLDWKERKGQLRERCGGRCEYLNSDGVRCRNEAADPHHIIRRSKQRDDRLTNLQALCRFHHDLMDERKTRWTKKGTGK